MKQLFKDVSKLRRSTGGEPAPVAQPSMYSRYSEFVVTALVIAYVIATHGDFHDLTEPWLPDASTIFGVAEKKSPSLSESVRTLASKLKKSISTY